MCPPMCILHHCEGHQYGCFYGLFSVISTRSHIQQHSYERTSSCSSWCHRRFTMSSGLGSPLTGPARHGGHTTAATRPVMSAVGTGPYSLLLSREHAALSPSIQQCPRGIVMCFPVFGERTMSPSTAATRFTRVTGGASGARRMTTSPLDAL